MVIISLLSTGLDKGHHETCLVLLILDGPRPSNEFYSFVSLLQPMAMRPSNGCDNQTVILCSILHLIYYVDGLHKSGSLIMQYITRTASIAEW